jgi:hypothetical protein
MFLSRRAASHDGGRIAIETLRSVHEETRKDTMG